MAKFPAMPLWTDAYLADCAGRLPIEEHGAYLLLMQLAWRDGGSLPGDRRELITWIKQVCRRCDLRVAKRAVDGVLDKFWVLRDDGRYIQKRLAREWAYCHRLHGTRAEVARNSWLTRREKVRTSHGVSADSNGLENDLHMHPHPHLEEETLSQSLGRNGVAYSQATESSTTYAVSKPKRRVRVGRLTPMEKETFERLWTAQNLTGQKRAKAQAVAAWNRNLSEGENPAGILELFTAHQECWVRHGYPVDKIPYLSTWLNQRRWLDDPPVPLSNGNGHGRPTAPDPDERKLNTQEIALVQPWGSGGSRYWTTPQVEQLKARGMWPLKDWMKRQAGLFG